ncbi:MAG: hypothetical protein KAT04_12985 [Methylococcales bacterium]|nr:hypothetical protein [Methylococcales bacterium]
MIENLELEVLLHFHGVEFRTLEDIKKILPDYDAQEISAALNALVSEGSIHKNKNLDGVTYSITNRNGANKITIEQINQQVDALKEKLKGHDIADFELKISALKKIGEIMADDIQQLLSEICGDLSKIKSNRC